MSYISQNSHFPINFLNSLLRHMLFLSTNKFFFSPQMNNILLVFNFNDGLFVGKKFRTNYTKNDLLYTADAIESILRITQIMLYSIEICLTIST